MGIHFDNSSDEKKMPLIKFVFHGHKFATWQPSSRDGPRPGQTYDTHIFIMPKININSNL